MGSNLSSFPPSLPFFHVRDVSKETGEIILRKEPRALVGADGGLGIWSQRQVALVHQGNNGTQAPPHPTKHQPGPGSKAISRGREEAFLASQSTGPGGVFDSLDDPRKVPALQAVVLWASRRHCYKGLGKEKAGLGEGLNPRLRTV